MPRCAAALAEKGGGTASQSVHAVQYGRSVCVPLHTLLRDKEKVGEGHEVSGFAVRSAQLPCIWGAQADGWRRSVSLEKRKAEERSLGTAGDLM